MARDLAGRNRAAEASDAAVGGRSASPFLGTRLSLRNGPRTAPNGISHPGTRRSHLRGGSGWGNPRQIFRERADQHNHYLCWGEDGEWIYYVHGTPATREMDLWRIRASGGNPERLTHLDSEMRDPTRFGTRTKLYVAHESDGSGPWIWAFDTVHKTARRITFGLEKYTRISVGRQPAPHGDRGQPEGRAVDRSDPPNSVRTKRDVKPFGLPSSRALTPRVRGSVSITYRLKAGKTSCGDIGWQDGGNLERDRGWITAASRGIRQRRTVAGSRSSLAKRKTRIVVAHSGWRRTFESVAPEIDVEGRPLAPDGNWIVTGGNDGKGDALFKIPTAGARPFG